MFRRIFGLSLVVSLLPACVQQPTNQGELALQRFRQDFAPNRATALAETIVVTAPTLEVRDPSGLEATSAGSADRAVTVQLRDHAQWNGVNVVWVDTGTDQLRDEDAVPYLNRGIRARSAKFEPMGNVITVTLTDVELPASTTPSSLEKTVLTLDFRRGSSTSRALVAQTNSLINRPPGIQFVGGD